MRTMTIELSGHEVKVLKDLIDELLGAKIPEMTRVQEMAKTIEKILFGAGP